ncbi:MAG: hypothetical protein ACE5GW_03150 [Planctomycetota bacterium]
MCGIVGSAMARRAELPPRSLRSAIGRLFLLSESRGSEASGIAVGSRERIRVHKGPLSPSRFLRTRAYRSFLESALGGEIHPDGGEPAGAPLTIIGHSRLVTNGEGGESGDNQPIVRGGLALVHNGIIVNDAAIWSRHPDLERRSRTDSELIAALVEEGRRRGDSPTEALAGAFRTIEGAASVALIFRDRRDLLLATNTGSVHTIADHPGRVVLFASERSILERVTRGRFWRGRWKGRELRQVKAGEGVLIDPATQLREAFEVPLSASRRGAGTRAAAGETRTRDAAPAEVAEPPPPALRRCTRCVLPETMPGIEFDGEGVCTTCRSYVKAKVLGAEALEKLVGPHRGKGGAADCIVAYSGGRDSSYGLHYIKNTLRMTPLAFTYDWGVITDLGRRNQARICGKLGIEHIVVSADIEKKRRNIRKNIDAWLKRPDLGMIPLFMAGDKHFYHYARKVQKQNRIPLFIFCAGNPLERTDFKVRFSGARRGSGGTVLTRTSWGTRLAMLLYYGREFLQNPAYINSSIIDTLFAFYSTYILPDRNIYLYDYIPWNEREIEDTLLGEYDWELAPDTRNTWRIGDGTAPFYNYLYHQAAGFTEFDTFRSNQIREGMITRAEALRLLAHDNEPRWESMEWYARTMEFDLDHALRVIESMPKLYAPGTDLSANDDPARAARAGEAVPPVAPRTAAEALSMASREPAAHSRR